MGNWKQKLNDWAGNYAVPRKNYILYVVIIADSLISAVFAGIYMPQTVEHFYGTISANPAYGIGIIFFVFVAFVLSFFLNMIDIFVVEKIKKTKIENLSGKRKAKYEEYQAETARKKTLQEADENEFFQQNPDLDNKRKKPQ